MTEIAHIGIAVEDLEKAIKIFTQILGHPPSYIKEVADQKVMVATFKSADNSPSADIELLEASDKGSSIAKFLAKRGPGLHHLAIKVENVERRLAELKSKGFRLIDEVPRIGAEGKKIAFVHPESALGVLIELEEK